MADAAGSRTASALLRWGAPLVLPLIALILGERAAADSLARAIGSNLSEATTRLPRREEIAADYEVDLGQPEPIGLPYAETALAALARPDAVAGPSRAPSRRRGILVREALVARAVASGGRPSGSPVPASGLRPAGVALHGISRFGSGLQDGDIVTNVGGAAVTSPGAVVACAAGTVTSGARVLTAVVWRGDQRIDVAIEIPRRRPARAK